MEITFAGATGTVTGSKFLLRSNSQTVLLDCGLYQGYKHLRRRNWAELPFEIDSIDAVVLSHAHIDHSGYLPRLVKSGYTGPIYCTESTLHLCNILLPDSGRIQEEDANYANKKGFSIHDPARPLYSEDDARKALTQFKSCQFNQTIELTKDFRVNFRPAGHIIGAAMTEITDGTNQLLFSGDLGRPDDPLLYPPENQLNPDLLILESTYGNRLHSPVDPQQKLGELVNQTVENNGTVLIPSFAVGRAQVLAFFLHRLKESGTIPDLPIYMDSPMAARATKIFNQNPALHRLDEATCRALDETITFTNSVEQSKQINRQTGPKIIISASGMATGGRVLHHLKVYAPHKENLILFVGYQAPGTRGAKILAGNPSVKIHGYYSPMRARIEKLDNISAHADHQEIIAWLETFKAAPEKTYLVHGSPDSLDRFRLKIEDKLGWDCQVPEYLGKVTLDNQQASYRPPEIPRIHV